MNIDVELSPELRALGAPTFQEFCQNRDKFLGKADDHFGQVDQGSRNLGKHVQRHRYEIEGYSCRSLEEVQRVAQAQGIPIQALDYRPEVVPQGGGKCDLLVRFVPKHVRERRQNW